MEEKLINLVRSYDLLYDITSKNYLNKAMRASAWRRIGIEMNKSGEECQKLWMNLRNNYRKALINRRSKVGDPTAKRRTIKYEKELQFIKEFIQERKRTSNFEDDSQFSFNDELAADADEERPLSELTNRSHQSSPTNEISQKNTEVKEIDPIDSFFQTMAATVKTLPPKIQAQVKRQVFSVISDAEVKHLEEKEIPTDHFATSNEDYYSRKPNIKIEYDEP